MKAVILNSGGLDTLAAMIILRKQNAELHSLYIGMGQPNDERARLSAKKLADEYCLTHYELTIPGKWSVNSPKAPAGGISIPYLSGVVFLLGCVYARKIEVDYVVSAVKGNFTEDFKPALLMLQKSLDIAPKIIIPVTPLEDKTDEDVYLIIKNNPLAKETTSCAHENPCGICKKCIWRKSIGID